MDYLECAFIVPLVRNGDRRPHNPLAWRELRDAMTRVFIDGSSGPERLYQIAPIPGRYTDKEGRTVEDESWRYFIALPEARIELRGLLKRVCNTIDQESIYLAIAGKVELVYGKPEDGFLGEVA